VSADDLAEFGSRLAELRATLAPPAGHGPFEVHTDGACLGNPGPGGWAAVVDDLERGTRWELWGHLGSTTNNRAEALGVLAAVEWLPAGAQVRLRADSQLTLNQLTGQWKVKANAEIWAEIRRALEAKRLRLSTQWVRGHAGDPGNERADELAMLGATNGDVARAAELRLRPRGPSRWSADPPSGGGLPPELAGLQPEPGWETDFVRSIAAQLRRGRVLSPKQQAVVDRIRARSAAR
jgi:ribonuclease HI